MRIAIKTKGSARIRQEARVIYTLLDAADHAGIIGETLVEPAWQETSARVRAGGNYEAEAEHFHEIITVLDASGALQGTWIEERWRTIQSRVMTAV